MKVVEIALDREPSCSCRARRLCSATLDEAGWEEFDYDTSLVVGELVREALSSSPGPLLLRIAVDPIVRVEVLCGRTGAAPTGPHEVLDAVATRWGRVETATGTIWWAELTDEAWRRSRAEPLHLLEA